MAVNKQQLKFYGPAALAFDDTSQVGGAIDKSKTPFFLDLAAGSPNIQIVSSDAGDTARTVIVWGRQENNSLVAEPKILNGQTPVPMTNVTAWYSIFRGMKVGPTVGDVAVESVTAHATGTAQAGAVATIDLAAGYSDEAFGMVLRITGGTGAGQIRQIVDYNSTTKVADVDHDWDTNPDNTSVYRLSEGMYFAKLPNEILEVYSIQSEVESDQSGGSPEEFYNCFFVSNENSTDALASATLAELSDPTGNNTFMLESTLNSSVSVANRLTAPAGTFDSETKDFANSGNLTAGSAQQVWLKFDRTAGQVKTKSFWKWEIQGN